MTHQGQPEPPIGSDGQAMPRVATGRRKFLTGAGAAAAAFGLGPALLARDDAAVAAQPAVGTSGTSYRGIVYVDDYGADPTGAADCTSAVNAALAALPTVTVNSQTWHTGKIIFSTGTYRLSSSSNNAGPLVIAEGQGRFITFLSYHGAGNAWTIQGQNSGSGFDTITFGGGIRELTIDGANASAGAIGLQIGDLEEAQINVGIQHFNGSGSIGFNARNSTRWTEKVDARLMLWDNSKACVLDSSAGSTSHEYCELDLTVYAEANQYALVIEDNMNVSGCFIRMRGNMLGAEPAVATAAAVHIGTNAKVTRSYLDVSMETPGTNPPKPITVQSGATVRVNGLLGFGGMPWGVSSIASDAKFDLLGQVVGDATVGALQNKVLKGTTTITLPAGSETATQAITFAGYTFDAPPQVVVSPATGGNGIGAISYGVSTTGATLRIFETNGANATSATTVTLNWLAVGNFF